MCRDILAVALNWGWSDYKDLLAHIEVVTGLDCTKASYCMFHPDTIPSKHLQKIWLKTLTMKLRGGCGES